MGGIGGLITILNGDYRKEHERQLRIELEGCRYLKQQLTAMRTKLRKRRDATVTERRQKMDELLGDYKTVDEAREAYGWDLITEKEFDEIRSTIENGERKAVEDDRDSVAVYWLNDFIRRLSDTISAIEFDLLPADEQDRRLKEAEEHERELEEIKKRLGRK